MSIFNFIFLYIRSYSKRLMTSLVYFVFIINSVSAEPQVNDLWFPDFVDARSVSNNLISNGVEIQIWEIRSHKRVAELLNYYQKLWALEPGYLNYDAGIWHVTGYVGQDWFVSLQVLKDQVDGFGYLSISQYPDKKPSDNAAIHFPFPEGTEILSDIFATDGPHKSRTITFKNANSFNSNAKFFRQYFSDRNWFEDSVPTSENGNSTILFRKGPDNATISINAKGSEVAGIAVIVEH